MTQAVLDAKAAGVGVHVLDLADAEPDADLVERLARVAAKPHESGEIDVLFVKNLDHVLIEPTGMVRVSPAIEDLNRRRDTLPDAVPAGVVLWLSGPAVDALAQTARALYDVVLTFFRFESLASPRVITPHDAVPFWIQLALPEEQSRLKREAAILETVIDRSSSSPATVADSLARLGQIRVLLGDASDGQRRLARAAEAYRELGDASAEASVLLRLGDVEEIRGDLDSAAQHYEAARLLLERLGDVRVRAVTMGKIADILQARGQLDEALRIRREEELPVYERLGDVRGRAITMGKIANVLQARGQLDEALRIHREEALPVFERLGDVRWRAITMGRIADVFQARGQLDDALRIRREEQLPVFERLGDVREWAVTMGRIADILQARGQLDEALRIYREQTLPAFERLGDVHSLLVAQVNTALILVARSDVGDRREAEALLRLGLDEAERLRIPEADQIRATMERKGIK